MAILRMLIRLDQGEKKDLREALDTPRQDEDAYVATDQLLSALTELSQTSRELIAFLGEMIAKEY